MIGTNQDIISIRELDAHRAKFQKKLDEMLARREKLDAKIAQYRSIIQMTSESIGQLAVKLTQ